MYKIDYRSYNNTTETEQEQNLTEELFYNLRGIDNMCSIYFIQGHLCLIVELIILVWNIAKNIFRRMDIYILNF